MNILEAIDQAKLYRKIIRRKADGVECLWFSMPGVSALSTGSMLSLNGRPLTTYGVVTEGLAYIHAVSGGERLSKLDNISQDDVLANDWEVVEPETEVVG